MKTVLEQAVLCRAAAPCLAALSTTQKNAALEAMAAALEAHTAEILAANALDLAAGQEAGMRTALLDRLELNEARIQGMAQGIRQVAALPDPVGQVVRGNTLPNGLQVTQKRVPLGVVGIIYEARPNVTADAAALCLKSGNAALLRGGKEARNSNLCLGQIMGQALSELGLPAGALQVVEDPSRESANAMMELTEYLDVLIPRGGAGLIRACVENATVPVIETGTGICHIYVDSKANQAMALDIIENAKCSRPSVCNAAEVCLVHRDIAAEFLPKLKQRLVDDRAAQSLPTVELRLDEAAAKIIDGVPAGETDFDTEFLDYIMAVKVVPSAYGAVCHINAHSTGHSEAVITEDERIARPFIDEVDSAAVYWNASTRFTDGGEFGLGCEMGISTQRLHARGPMGLAELCSYKYVVRGTGQVR